MTLDDLDRRVRAAAASPVALEAFPAGYYDETGASPDALGPVLPDPGDELVLSLLADRYPGVELEAADEFPAFREPDPVPIFAYAR